MSTNNMQKTKHWTFYYSIGFALAALILWVAFANKSLIALSDGYLQFYTAAQYAKTFWTTLFEFKLPMMDFTIGEGLSPFQSMTYYGITEPWSLLYVIVPSAYIHIAYNTIIAIKLFLSGLAFGWYAKKYSSNHVAIGLGALVYIVSGFFVWWISAPPFLNVGYLFPILLYLMDMAFEKKKYTPLAIVTCIAYVMNYYIAMVMSFMLMAYAIIRIFMAKEWDKKAIFAYGKIVLSHALGILASAVILLPTFLALMSSTRLTAPNAQSLLLYPLNYYIDLIRVAFLPATNMQTYWLYPYSMQMSFLPIALPCLLMFIKAKTEPGSKERRLKWALFACGLFIMFPIFGWIFNATQYATHRWAFAFALVMGLITVWGVPKFNEMPTWVKWTSAAWLIVGAVLTFFFNVQITAICTAITAVILIFVTFIKPSQKKALVAGLLAVILFVFTSFPGYQNGKMFASNRVYDRVYDELYAMVDLTDEEKAEFIRISSADCQPSTNAGVILGMKTTSTVWNVIPGVLGDYNVYAQQMPRPSSTFWVYGFDDRTAAFSLAGVQYYVTSSSSDSKVPYGFQLYDIVTQEVTPTPSIGETIMWDFYIYKNLYNPGVGYMFTETLSLEQFNKLDIASKQLALMKYAIIDNENAGANADVMAYEIPIELIETEDGYEIKCNIPDGFEVYISMDNVIPNYSISQISFNGGVVRTPEDITVTATDERGIISSGKLEPQADHTHIVVGTDIRTLNLGSKLCGETTITIDNKKVDCQADNIKLYACSTSQYVTSVKDLMNNSWTNVEYSDAQDGTNYIAGHINANEDGVFQLAVPYDSGWKAYVDGEEVDIFACGVKYMGINLTAGEHDIRFEYTTPGLLIGAIVSIISILIVAVWLLIEYRKEIKWLFTESKYSSACKYLVTGCGSTATDFILYMTLCTIGLPIPVAKICSGIVVTCISFFINRKWTFKADTGDTKQQVFKYFITQGCNIGGNTIVNSLVLSVLDIKLIAFVIATLVGMTISFTMQKLWVFRQKEVKAE